MGLHDVELRSKLKDSHEKIMLTSVEIHQLLDIEERGSKGEIFCQNGEHKIVGKKYV